MNFLIVDDIETNREAIKLGLDNFIQENEITIFEASDGIEAIKLTNEHQMDLIFMDIMMPKMNGYSAISNIKLKHKNQNIYIIAITALDSKDDVRKAMSVGADSFVTKPFKKDNLLKEIKTFIKLKSAKHENKSSFNTKLKQPYSLYKDKYKNVLTVFSINNEDDVSTIWDLTDGFYELYNKTKLIDFLSIIYELQENVEYFAVIMELGDNSLYFSIDNPEAMNYLRNKKIDMDYEIREIITFHLPLFEDVEIKPKEEQFFINYDDECENEFIEERYIIDEMNNGYKRISSKEYFQTHDISSNIIDKFLELDDRLVDLFYDSDSISQDEIDLLASIFEDYVVSLNNLYVFTNLAYVLQSLTSTLKTVDIYVMDDEFKKCMFDFLLIVSKDLLKWASVVLIEKKANDIHYLESSLMSSVQQFEKSLQERNFTYTQNDDDDFELF
jgi:two-component system chemotaxis response regulator CheY